MAGEHTCLAADLPGGLGLYDLHKHTFEQLERFLVPQSCVTSAQAAVPAKTCLFWKADWKGGTL